MSDEVEMITWDDGTVAYAPPGVHVGIDWDSSETARMMASPTAFVQSYLGEFVGQENNDETRYRINDGMRRILDGRDRHVSVMGGRRGGRTEQLRRYAEMVRPAADNETIANIERVLDTQYQRTIQPELANNDRVNAIAAATYAAIAGRTPAEQAEAERTAITTATAEITATFEENGDNNTVGRAFNMWQAQDHTTNPALGVNATTIHHDHHSIVDLVYGPNNVSMGMHGSADFDGDVLALHSPEINLERERERMERGVHRSVFMSTPSGENHLHRAWTDNSGDTNTWTNGVGKSLIFDALPNLIKDENKDVMKEALKGCSAADVSNLRQACAEFLNGVKDD